jgi:hypothetical protein
LLRSHRIPKDAAGRLTLPAGDHQSCANYEQSDAYDGRDFLVIVRGDADMGVANSDSVLLRMRKGHEERNNSQHQHNHSNQHERFHGMPPKEIGRGFARLRKDKTNFFAADSHGFSRINRQRAKPLPRPSESRVGSHGSPYKELYP